MITLDIMVKDKNGEMIREYMVTRPYVPRIGEKFSDYRNYIVENVEYFLAHDRVRVEIKEY